ncbi:MAG: peroxiredoxin [Bryobacteraceae bacterium]|jgi:peroxiredoxin Q/BCP
MSFLRTVVTGFPVVLLTSALMFAAVSFASAADMPSVGQTAPAFTLNSQEGKPVSLNDFRGKWVVLYFYPKDMTSGCTIEAHNFQRDLAQYDKTNAVILGVSVDSVDSHQQFCTKESLTFKLLSDASHTVVDAYGSLSPSGVAARNTFLIDPKGVIRKVFVKVNPTPHSEEVLAALAELKKANGE